ncbi:MAG: hypothetical protein ABIR39_23525 [Nocardioides sp.]|uniref:hypothetical protein n=1 Tax=Nocardioides sp. TaxID=35761 RepID=UPI003264CD8E
MPIRERFTGQIAGVGSSSGVRVVVGRWASSPWGPFADVMIEDATGHRVLLAPDEQTRDFVVATYTFDEVVLEPVSVSGSQEWHVSTPSLDLLIHVGRRTALGQLLRAVPPRIATAPAWCAAVDPVARVALRGVRTRGTAGQGRREWYGATSVHQITALAGSWRGEPLGALAPVDPPCRFGFSSTPRRPSVTSVVTTVERS